MPLINIYEPGFLPKQNQKSENLEQDLAIGIDLGTTNSLVAFCQNQKPEILNDQEGNFSQPSIVGVCNNSLLSGRICQNLEEKVYSIKRLMGKGFSDLENIKSLPFEIKNYQGQIKITLGNEDFTAVELSAQILLNLKQIAENNLKKPVKKAVITVPAYFDEAARNSTKQAADLAGLEVLRLINEPTAAAVAYGLDKKTEGKFLIFDLGGGTFDVSILELSSGVFKVLAVGGDSSLGGDDFDNLISQKIIDQHNLSGLTAKDWQQLQLISRNIKEQFTNQNIAEASFEINKKNYQFILTKTEFNFLSQELVIKTINITKRLLTEIDLEIEQIEAVILVGGSTRLSEIKSSLETIFGKDKILSDIDPDKIVALGASIQAEALTGNKEGNLLLDVAALSLGVEVMGGLVEKIIHRNSTIPTSASREFTTYIDGQTAMKLHILQGERELAKDCRSLAKFEIKNIPALKAGVARILVVFKVDADGLLTVEATEKISGQKQYIEARPSFGLSPELAKEMLLEALKNSKNDIEERLLTESIVEANRSILALEKALEEDGNLLDNQTLAETQKQIKKLQKTIISKNKTKINLEAENLEKFAQKLAEKRMDRDIAKSLIGKKIDDL